MSKNFDLGPAPGTVAKLFEVEAERDALRVENEQLREAVAWNEEQRGIQAREIERLREQLRVAEMMADSDEYDVLKRMQAENERLQQRLADLVRAIKTYRQSAASVGNPMMPWPALDLALDV